MDNKRCALCGGSSKYVCSNPVHSSDPSKCPRQSGLPKHTCPDCKGSGACNTRGTSRPDRGSAERDAVVCTNSWAGRLETPVKVLLQTSTPKRYRVRYLESAVRRQVGEVVLVPKYAVRFTDGEPAPVDGLAAVKP